MTRRRQTIFLSIISSCATASLFSHPPGLSGEKVHTSTVALVPPEVCWPPVQAVRLELRDKGLYRWPPHVNLLYPFVPEEEFKAAAQEMSATLANVKPTTVTFDALNTFGGRSRGVLYACCSNPAETAALCELQAALQSALPFCSEQQKNGVFVPHMTLSHFACRDDAEAAKSQLLESWSPITFSTGDECVHVMRRLGGSGQFERACTLRFGGCDASNEVSSRAPIFFEPPLRFEEMLREEEEWMRQARRDSYKRGSGGGRRGSRRRPRRTPEERAAILARTPEEIAAIRAERAAKRARLLEAQVDGEVESGAPG